MIEAVVFDYGGVISDPRPRLEALERYDRLLGLAAGTLQAQLFSGPVWEAASTGAISEREYWEMVGAPLEPLLPPEFARFRQDPFALEGIDWEMVRLIKSLAGHFTLALCSNAFPSLLDRLHEIPGLMELFSVVVISALVGLRKPDERIYRLVSRDLGVPPERILFVDDKVRNLRAAEAVGMATCHHTSARETAACLARWTATRGALGEGSNA